MKKLLGEICSSFFGANASAKHQGEIPCVMGRDFDSEGLFYPSEQMYLNQADVVYTTFLQPGQVLFSSKGKIFAAYWNGQIKNAVATGTFIVLEVIDPDVLPEYLTLYLNSTKARRFYELHMKTATVNHIGKKQLEQMEIEIPSIEKQKTLIKLSKLASEENRICNEIKKKKENIINQLI